MRVQRDYSGEWPIAGGTVSHLPFLPARLSASLALFVGTAAQLRAFDIGNPRDDQSASTNQS